MSVCVGVPIDLFCTFCYFQNTWVPRKIVASNVPTTIDKLHADHHQQAEEMKRMTSDLRVEPSNVQYLVEDHVSVFELWLPVHSVGRGVD